MPTFIRVKDEDTGDEFDIAPDSLRSGMTVLRDYPPNSGDGAQPRPAKLNVDKAGNRALPSPPAPETETKSELAPASPADTEE